MVSKRVIAFSAFGILAVGAMFPIQRSSAQIRLCLGFGNECPNGMFESADQADQPTETQPAVKRIIHDDSRIVEAAEATRATKLKYPQNLESFRRRWGNPEYESLGLARWRSQQGHVNAVLDESGTKITSVTVR